MFDRLASEYCKSHIRKQHTTLLVHNMIKQHDATVFENITILLVCSGVTMLGP